MKYLETSFLLTIILKEPFSPFCKQILSNSQAKNEQIIVSTLTLLETVGVLERREKWSKKKIINEIEKILGKLKSYKITGIENSSLISDAFPIWEKFKIASFYDILHYLTMKRLNISEIFATEEHFDLFPDIKRSFLD